MCVDFRNVCTYFLTHALFNSNACVYFAMYVRLLLMFALCFKRFCVFLPYIYAGFRTNMCVFQTYTSHFPRKHCYIPAHASVLRCMCFFSECSRCVSNVIVCSDLTHSLVFGHICDFLKCVHHNSHACVVFFSTCVHFVTYVLVWLTFVLCFKRICLY